MKLATTVIGVFRDTRLHTGLLSLGNIEPTIDLKKGIAQQSRAFNIDGAAYKIKIFSGGKRPTVARKNVSTASKNSASGTIPRCKAEVAIPKAKPTGVAKKATRKTRIAKRKPTSKAPVRSKSKVPSVPPSGEAESAHIPSPTVSPGKATHGPIAHTQQNGIAPAALAVAKDMDLDGSDLPIINPVAVAPAPRTNPHPSSFRPVAMKAPVSYSPDDLASDASFSSDESDDPASDDDDGGDNGLRAVAAPAPPAESEEERLQRDQAVLEQYYMTEMFRRSLKLYRDRIHDLGKLLEMRVLLSGGMRAKVEALEKKSQARLAEWEARAANRIRVGMEEVRMLVKDVTRVEVFE